jgi:hypothetical protein
VLEGTKVGEGSGDRLRSLGPKIQNWAMKTFKITSLHQVQSVGTCSEYTNTGRDKEIRGVTAPDR